MSVRVVPLGIDPMRLRSVTRDPRSFVEDLEEDEPAWFERADRSYFSSQPGYSVRMARALMTGERHGEQVLMTDLHQDFKRYKGYSDVEIAQKRAALEQVLVPNTRAEHLERLADAGFAVQQQCVRCLNFEAFIAIR